VVLKLLFQCLSRQTFFGLTDRYMKNVFDLLFDLKYYGGFSIFESFNLPVGLRKYYSERLEEKLEQEKEAMEKAKNKSSHSSPPRKTK